MFSLLPVLNLVVAALLVCTDEVESSAQYMYLIPNGQRVVRQGQPWPAVGHPIPYNPQRRLNAFGKAFAAVGREWTAELCTADSDGDGEPNGVELGDPQCRWRHNMSRTEKQAFDSAVVSHPGFPDSTSAVEQTLLRRDPGEL